MRFATTVVASGLALMSGVAVAHPGHDISGEVAERRAFLAGQKRADLSHCAAKLKARGLSDRNVRRRAAAADEARARRGLKKKREIITFDSVLATDHNKTDTGVSPNSPYRALFGDYNSCTLTPEATQGPYYVSGEYVRRDIRESQAGVDVVADYQVIDINTCLPIPNAYLEIWHCNATGVYSGVSSTGQGGLDSTFLRGIQKTDRDGVAQFETVFPGHYTGRATHIHTMVHLNGHELGNGTIGVNTTSSHVGQTFFDQDLISAVEVNYPYTTNEQELTLNSGDDILESEADGVDPLMQYALLGDSVADGIYAWISYGVNATASEYVSPAAIYYAGGGADNDDFDMGGGGGGGPDGAGGMPSGIPSGSVGSMPAAATSSASA
ncbi:aromatic compound dioxygenase [Xylariomycetidae sp. FL2044]|nr:aromatic compound dioxygenase [Xylariomycetidae sp. FL2044]